MLELASCAELNLHILNYPVRTTPLGLSAKLFPLWRVLHDVNHYYMCFVLTADISSCEQVLAKWLSQIFLLHYSACLHLIASAVPGLPINQGCFEEVSFLKKTEEREEVFRIVENEGKTYPWPYPSMHISSEKKLCIHGYASFEILHVSWYLSKALPIFNLKQISNLYCWEVILEHKP